MPLQEHPDLAIPRTDPDNDVACMSLVLSPSVAAGPPLSAPPFSQQDGSAPGTEPAASSFRLQMLRAWIAARGNRKDEVAGHA